MEENQKTNGINLPFQRLSGLTLQLKSEENEVLKGSALPKTTKQVRSRARAETQSLTLSRAETLNNYGFASGKSLLNFILWWWDNMVTGVTHPWLEQVISWLLDGCGMPKATLSQRSIETLRPVNATKLHIFPIYPKLFSFTLSFLHCTGFLLPDPALLLSLPSFTSHCTLWNLRATLDNILATSQTLAVAVGLNWNPSALLSCWVLFIFLCIPPRDWKLGHQIPHSPLPNPEHCPSKFT